MRTLPSQPPKAIVIPQQLQRLASRASTETSSTRVSPSKDLMAKYASIVYSNLEEQRHVRQCDAELVTTTHRGQKALISYDFTNPLLAKQHAIPVLEALRRERPRTVGLKKYQDVSILSRAYAQMIDKVQSGLFQSGFLRIYDDPTGVLAPSEARERTLAHQRMARYRVLELEYMEHARSLHEQLSPLLVDYTNRMEYRHHLLLQFIANYSIENLFVSLSTQTLYKSVQSSWDEVPIILFQCRLEDVIRESVPVADLSYKQTRIDTLTTNDLVSISELAQAIASEQTAEPQDSSILHPTIQQSSQPYTDVLTLGRHLSTMLLNEDNASQDSLIFMNGSHSNTLNVCNDLDINRKVEDTDKNSVSDTIITRLLSPDPQLYASQQETPSSECINKQGPQRSPKNFQINTIVMQKYTKSGLPLPQSRLSTRGTSRLKAKINLSDLNHGQYEALHATNPILAKPNHQQPANTMEPLIGRAIQSPPAKPRTVSRMSVIRSPIVSIREAMLPPKDLQACLVPFTKITFQPGSPGSHLSEPGVHPIRDPFSESESSALEGFDALEDLPQSQGFHLRAQAPLHAHASSSSRQDQNSNKFMFHTKNFSLKNPGAASSTHPYPKLRDRFGSPLLALSTKRFSTEVTQVLKCKEHLQLCISQYCKLALYGNPSNYSTGFIYTSWLTEDPINVVEAMRHMVPQWPSEKSYERLHRIRRISSELATNLPRKLIWMSPAYREPFNDVRDLCFSILWMLTGEYAPSWYVPSSRAMKKRRADMNRRFLVNLGAIDTYDEREMTSGVFTQLVSPNKKVERKTTISRDSTLPFSRPRILAANKLQELDISDSAHDPSDSVTSIKETEHYDTHNAAFQELYYKEVPAVKRFHFPKNWIVYGAYLTSSIPHYHENLDFVLAELESKSNHSLISMGPVIERVIKHEKNDNYDSSFNLDHADLKRQQLTALTTNHVGEGPYLSNDEAGKPLDAELYLMNGGVTPYVSPCFSEFSSFTTIGSDSGASDNNENSQPSSLPDSGISLLYEDGDISIRSRPSLQSEQCNSGMSISELTESQEKLAAKVPFSSINTLPDDWTDTLVQHVIHRLKTYSKMQLQLLRDTTPNHYMGHYAALNMQVVSAGKSINGCTQSTNRSSPPTTPHIPQMKVTRRLLARSSDQHVISSVARIIEHPLDFTDELSVSEHPTAFTHRVRVHEDKPMETNTIMTPYDSRRLHVIDIHYPNRRALRKGCYVNLQFLADFSYFRETEERRREISEAYPLDPDIYVTDSTIRGYYDEPLLPYCQFQDPSITAGVYIVTKSYTKPSQSVTFIDGLLDDDVMKITKNKKAHVQHWKNAPHLYIPFIRTILRSIGATHSFESSLIKPNIISRHKGESLFCKPCSFTHDISHLQTSQRPTAAITAVVATNNVQETEPQTMSTERISGEIVKADKQLSTVCFIEPRLKGTNAFEHQAFELSDNNLLTLFSLRISNIKEIINKLLYWVEMVYTILMLDGRAFLSSICGSSYWADVTNSLLELEKRSRKEQLAAMYRRYLHSRDVRNIPEIAYPEEDQAHIKAMDNLQVFELKRNDAIRFLRLANRMYAEYVAEAIAYIVCQVVIPTIKSILSLITKEAMAMADLARLTVFRYMLYLKKVEPDHTILVRINTDHLKILDNCERVTNQIFWLFRHITSVDNSLITVSHTSETKDPMNNQCLRMAKVIIRCIPSMRAAWNVCKLMFIKVRTTLNAGMQCLVNMPKAPTLPRYAFRFTADSEDVGDNYQQSNRSDSSGCKNIVFGYSSPNMDRPYSMLQLEFSLKKNTQPCTISELSQFEYLLPKAPSASKTTFTDETSEKQFWPFHKYGYYHLLHSLFERFDDRIEPLKTLISTGNKGVVYDCEDCNSSKSAGISLIDSEEDYVDEKDEVRDTQSCTIS
ncbi:Hypothetical protein GLP15_785 [Giardia lamblia P15]|uniref:Uncharacterized protein n=1 Tax=Giardia intestinalis (strain P15) TaxID=658858 RepID=E1EXW9_GIAIA|nr:Hypothetical protein GLP15_785 [Giardia lamblia P15]